MVLSVNRVLGLFQRVNDHSYISFTFTFPVSSLVIILMLVYDPETLPLIHLFFLSV